eukprot:6196865-Pleurochrysis_carterae.AAC.5
MHAQQQTGAYRRVHARQLSHTYAHASRWHASKCAHASKVCARQRGVPARRRTQRDATCTRALSHAHGQQCSRSHAHSIASPFERIWFSRLENSEGHLHAALVHDGHASPLTRSTLPLSRF